MKTLTVQVPDSNLIVVIPFHDWQRPEWRIALLRKYSFIDSETIDREFADDDDFMPSMKRRTSPLEGF